LFEQQVMAGTRGTFRRRAQLSRRFFVDETHAASCAWSA